MTLGSISELIKAKDVSDHMKKAIIEKCIVLMKE